MANGKSQISTAQEMTLSVAQNLDEAKDDHLPEFVEHLENRKAELEALFEDSHQEGWKEIIALLDTAIEALKKVIERLGEGAQIARDVEGRL
jgi:Zn-dependent oligopeptidase